MTDTPAQPKPPIPFNTDRLTMPVFPDGSRWVLVTDSDQAHRLGAASGTSLGHVFDADQRLAKTVERRNGQRYLALLDAAGTPEAVLSVAATVHEYAHLDAVVPAPGRTLDDVAERIAALSADTETFVLVARYLSAWTVNPNVDARIFKPLHQRRFEDIARVRRAPDGHYRSFDPATAPAGHAEHVENIFVLAEDCAARYFTGFRPHDGMRQVPFGQPGYTARVDLLSAKEFNSLVVTDDRTGEVVGGLFLGMLWVEPLQRGQGLGAEIILAATQQGDLRLYEPRHHTDGGLAAAKRAYMLGIERHLTRSSRIRKDVLASYNGLRRDAGLEPLEAHALRDAEPQGAAGPGLR